MEGPRPRKHHEGWASMGASFAASDPWSVCACVCVCMFSECGVLSFVLRFSVIFSAPEIPRGQNQGQNHWAEDLWCFTS